MQNFLTICNFPDSNLNLRANLGCNAVVWASETSYPVLQLQPKCHTQLQTKPPSKNPLMNALRLAWLEQIQS